MYQKHTCNHSMTVRKTEKMFANVVYTEWECSQCGYQDFTCHHYDDVHVQDIQKALYEISRDPKRLFANIKYLSVKL